MEKAMLMLNCLGESCPPLQPCHVCHALSCWVGASLSLSLDWYSFCHSSFFASMHCNGWMFYDLNCKCKLLCCSTVLSLYSTHWYYDFINLNKQCIYQNVHVNNDVIRINNNCFKVLFGEKTLHNMQSCLSRGHGMCFSFVHLRWLGNAIYEVVLIALVRWCSLEWLNSIGYRKFNSKQSVNSNLKQHFYHFA